MNSVGFKRAKLGLRKQTWDELSFMDVKNPQLFSEEYGSLSSSSQDGKYHVKVFF